MKVQFKNVKFRAVSLERIAQAEEILNEYDEMGLCLTVRQLFYQLVSRGLLPNTMRHYKGLVKLMTKAREGGLIDWSSIEDRGRQVIYPDHWNHPGEIVQDAHDCYRRDRWANQEHHIEVMLEKDALAGVLAGICDELDVRLIPNRGYASASIMYRHGRRLRIRERAGKQLHLLYLGDHDPSGLDMDRDIEERLTLYSYNSWVQFERLALTREQIDEYQPPPNPAKLSDSRAWTYISEHGNESWELDALEPTVLRDLVQAAVFELRDVDKHAEVMEEETAEKATLQEFVDEWKDREND